MDSFGFHDIRAEKANAIAKYRRIQTITTLFRFVELFVFLIVLSRFSTQFSFSLKFSTDLFRRIALTLISPRSVFVLGNAIVIALFLISGKFSGKKSEKVHDFYDEYVERCRNMNKQEKRAASDALEEKVLSRAHSANIERSTVRVEERRRDLRRSMSEKCRKSVDGGRKAAAAAEEEEEMSGEEFRRTVEAFIARQQRFLREEEEFSAVAQLGA